MQQFRPLPRFDQLEEAEAVEKPPLPGFQLDARSAVTPVQTGQRLATAPYTTDGMPVLPPSSTGGIPVTPSANTGHIPIVLLSGPHPTSDTDRLAALIKPAATPVEKNSLTAALQSTLRTTGSQGRITIIPAEGKKRRARTANAPVRRLNARLRHSIIILSILAVGIWTMLTLAPLSDSNNGDPIKTLQDLIKSAQNTLPIQAHQYGTTGPIGANLPAMMIPDSSYVTIAEDAAKAVGISPVYFVRQINQESHFNPNAVSPAGAVGIAQFLPSTAAGLGIDPWNPTQALYGAARLMARQYHQYGDYAKALAAYNAGPGQLQSAVNVGGTHWLDFVPAETRHYIYIIMGI